jgi:acyl dehydratase
MKGETMKEAKFDKRNEPEFNPDTFLLVPPKRFEDLKVGDIFRAPSRTLTDAHAAAFQTVSADNHPMHYYYAVWAARQKML